MNLTEKPDVIDWPLTHFLFVEKIGPFMETAQKAWEELHKGTPEISKQHKISRYMSLYKIEPKMLYRAGVAIEGKPSSIPEGFKYEAFEGGKYARFVLTGSYANLPKACGRVFQTVKETGLPVRPGYFIENYVNDPRTTPEDQLVTEILIPTK